jgi:hypothetical protein
MMPTLAFVRSFNMACDVPGMMANSASGIDS